MTIDADTEPDVAPAVQQRRGVLAPFALAVAVVSAAVAGWALLDRPAAVTTETPTAQQVQESKPRVCSVFDVVRTGVSVQTNTNLGDDPVAREAVAANARLAILGGGGYLLSTIDPATPPDLAGQARSFATLLQGIGAQQLSGTASTDAGLAARMTQAQEASVRVAGLCAD